MEKYDYPVWGDQYKESADITYRIASQIRTATKRIVKNEVSFDYARTLFTNIINAVRYWTGFTYVGSKKKPELEKAYQAFFKALSNFFLSFREIDKPEFQESADKILYRGTVYRYLGHDSYSESEVKIEPIYNDIYVSWSKEPTNTDIENKLCGTMTWLSAEIHEPYYGIDLEGLEDVIYRLVGIYCNLNKENEREVVFPTIKECIINKKYISEDNDDKA